jgi:TetR/AcrR family transcriptional regulator, cholesterol catabolism regulator
VTQDPAIQEIQKPGRRERRRLEVRARVLEAGWFLFEERGYDTTTVAEICERADIAYGTFFNHFSEKYEVLRIMADQAIGLLEGRLEDLAKEDGTIEEHLVILFEGTVREHDDDERIGRDLLGRIYSIAYAESPEDRDRRYHAAFERYMEESVARGRVRDDAPIETLAEIVASLVGSFVLSWVHFEDFPIHERARSAARVLAESLRPRPS